MTVLFQIVDRPDKMRMISIALLDIANWSLLLFPGLLMSESRRIAEPDHWSQRRMAHSVPLSRFTSVSQNKP
jgi:hypothetical protein